MMWSFRPSEIIKWVICWRMLQFSSKSSEWGWRYLPFTGKDVFEGCVVSVSSPGLVSVPALDRDCCLVHPLDKPSREGSEVWSVTEPDAQKVVSWRRVWPLGLLLRDLPPARRDGAAVLGWHWRSVVWGGGDRREILLRLGQGAVL